MNDKRLFYITMTLAILAKISLLFVCKKLLFITCKTILIVVIFLSIFQRKFTDVQVELTMFKGKWKNLPRKQRTLR